MQQGVARSADPAAFGSIQHTLALMEKTPLLLETLLRDLPQELLRWKPAADRWSITEVLAHLVDIELVYADRTRRIVTEDAPALRKYEPSTENGNGDEGRREDANACTFFDEKLATFFKTRRATLILLRSIPADSGDREATHSELGRITLQEMLNEWASHDLGHLRQIAELYRARAFHPYAGPFQEYSNPRP